MSNNMGDAFGLYQNVPNQQWGNTSPYATAQQGRSQVLGQGAYTQGQGYANQMGDEAAQQVQQYGQLGATYGQQGSEQYGQLRDAQASGYMALQNLAAAASGQTPSAAQIQMQQGLDQAARQQMAGAASSRGGFGLANAQYNAANNAAALQQGGVDAGAALRAQEMAAAQQAYMQGSLGMGNLASQSALGFQGQQLGAAEAGTQAQLGYQQSGENAVQQGEALQQEYEGQGIGAQNAAAQTGLGWGQINQQQQAANQGQTNALIGAGLTAVGTIGGAMIGGPAGAAGGAALGGMAAKGIESSGTGSQAGSYVGSMGGGQAGSSIGSDARVKREVRDAALEQGRKEGIRMASAAPVPMPGPQLPPPPTPAQALAQGHTVDQEALRAQGVRPPSGTPVVGHYQHQYDRSGAPVHDVYDMPDPRLAYAPQPAQPAPQPLALNSDERIKDSPGSTEPPVDRFLGSLKPKTFAYKDAAYEPNPAGDGDRYLGIMAQDLERTPEGAKLVREDARGMKVVDVPALSGATAAAMGRLHERLSRLEGRRGAGVR